MSLYLPGHFRDDDRALALALIAAQPFATLVSTLDGAPFVTHLPLLLSADGTQLLGHVARANPQSAAIGGAVPSVAIFHGPHAYVSPRWYARRPAVPTWNYAVVHVSGLLQPLPDGEALRAVQQQLVERFEAAALPEGVMPETHVAQLSTAIVGFALAVEHVDTKLKFGQHRSLADQQGVEDGLLAEGGAEGAALVELQRRLGYPKAPGR